LVTFFAAKKSNNTHYTDKQVTSQTIKKAPKRNYT